MLRTRRAASAVGRDGSGKRRALGLHVAALAARPRGRAPVERLDGRAQIALDVHRAHGGPVNDGVAAFAVPEERLGVRGPALDLDDETPGVSRAVRRVGGM